MRVINYRILFALVIIHLMSGSIALKAVPDRSENSRASAVNKVVSDKRFKVSVTVPLGWKSDLEHDDDGVVILCEEQNGLASVTLIAVDWGWKVDMEEFIPLMEQEIRKEYPLGKRVTMEGGKPPLRGFTWQQFAGESDAYDIVSLVGYASYEKHGYVLIGVFGRNDKAMETAVLEVFRNCSLPFEQ